MIVYILQDVGVAIAVYFTLYVIVSVFRGWWGR